MSKPSSKIDQASSGPNVVTPVLRVLLVVMMGYYVCRETLNGAERLMWQARSLKNFATELIGALAAGGEFFGGVLVNLGLFTQLALGATLLSLAAAALLAHLGHQFSRNEIALAYGVLAAAVFLVGAVAYDPDFASASKAMPVVTKACARGAPESLRLSGEVIHHYEN